MKNYKALKAAAKISIADNGDSTYTLTKKAYDPDTGLAIEDEVSVQYLEIVSSEISRVDSLIARYASEKEDWELLKVDMEAL